MHTIDFHELRPEEASMGAVTKLSERLFAPAAEAARIELSFDAVTLPRPCIPTKPKPHGRDLRDG